MNLPLPSRVHSSVTLSQAVRWVVHRGWTVLLAAATFAPLNAAPLPSAQPLSVAPAHSPGFQLMNPRDTGVLFTNSLATERHLTNQILLNGSGIAAGDVDGDGRCDLYFCRLDGSNALYRNLGGWQFEDVTAEAGVACPGQDSTGACLADLDGDSDLDLVVNSIDGPTRFFFNDGRGRFQESDAQPGLNRGRGAMSVALADMDGDGDLDLYVANYRKVTLRDQPNTKFTFKIVDGQAIVTGINGRPLTDPEFTNRFEFHITVADGGGSFRHDENGEPDLLLRNDGAGRFQPVPFTGGAFMDEEGRALTRPPMDWGLSVMFRDLTGDGKPDLYVCNDFKSEDRFWLNVGPGRFQALPRLAMRQMPLSSMGMDAADLNRDGWDDLFVVDMLSPDPVRRLTQRMEIRPEMLPAGVIDNRPQYPRNMLQISRGDGTYAEIAQAAGLEATDWSWTPAFIDVDLDGFEDLLVSNGFERDGMNVDVLMRLEAMKRQRDLSPEEQLRLRRIFPRLDTPNFAFRNQGDLTFQDKSRDWGFAHPGIATGLALADLDGDGDQDVVLNQLNGSAGLYRNESSAPRIAVRLRGARGNSHGVGARIRVSGGPVVQHQVVIAGGRYLSSDEPTRTFAALADPMEIDVLWPSGSRSRVTDARPNHAYLIHESDAAPLADDAKPADTLWRSAGVQPKASNGPWFEDVSERLGHRHAVRFHNDWERQPLLAHQGSRPGPALAWGDADGDGWDDLAIGAGQDGQMGWFVNDRNGRFRATELSHVNESASRDHAGLLILSRRLFIAYSNYEDEAVKGEAMRVIDPLGGQAVTAMSSQPWCPGPLAAADVDGDGDVDVFIGGRVVPGRFPEAASSKLLLRNGDGWKEAEAGEEVFNGVGMVQGAVFSDLDGDGDPDLILACHWGPVRVLMNEGGRFQDRTGMLGLEQYHGWWNGVATGDLNGDGRPDIVASNWGRNTRVERFRSAGLYLVGSDFDGNGTVEGVEAHGNPARPLQPRHWAVQALPMLAASFPTHERYAQATVAELYGPATAAVRPLRVDWPDTTVFINRGQSFEAQSLPFEAQWAPAFAVCVADADGDGRLDVFLSQNFFATHPEVSRYDAGRGLWLRGDGQGGLSTVPARMSGVTVYGDQRAAAVGDFDQDGRVDLAVTQNGAETRLFRNVGGRPGLRVRLKGTPENPASIGAVLRPETLGGLGPVREIQAGSGYWGQNSAVEVLASEDPITAIHVRWPDGRASKHTIEPGATAVELSHSERRPP